MYLLIKHVLTWGSTDTEKAGRVRRYMCVFPVHVHQKVKA